MSQYPIAIFTYNRPKHTRQMLDSLSVCSRLGECRIVIFSDAPRIPEHAQGVEETRRLVYEWSSLNQAQVVERNENWGLARSIVDGVTQLCEQYGRVIVLEDDFILHPAFLDFMIQSLDKYEDDEQVAQVAGFTFPIDIPEKPDAFFLPLTTSWGWATWQRAWKLFSWDLKDAFETLSEDALLRHRFNLNGEYPYYEMLRKCMNGEVDSWAIRWYWYTFVHNMVTLYPRLSIVWQNGFDEFGTNTLFAQNIQGSYDSFLLVRETADFVFPKVTSVDEVAFTHLKNFLHELYWPVESLPFWTKLKKIKNRILGL